MITRDASQKFAALLHRIDPHATLKGYHSLPGGFSADVTLLEVEAADGARRRFVHRLHGEVDLRQNPNVAVDEFRVLQMTHAAGLATPAPVYLDATAPLFPTPSLVLEYVDGHTDLKPGNPLNYVTQMACELARIHQMDTSGQDLSFLLKQEVTCAEALGRKEGTEIASPDARRLLDLLAPCWPLPRSNVPVVLHGDYWPGNTLWQDGRLAAVIDWEDTRYGDPLADVSNARFEILICFGVAVMEAFTRQYASLNPVAFDCLPWWDIFIASRVVDKLASFTAPERNESRIRADHQWFVEQARSRMGSCRSTR